MRALTQITTVFVDILAQPRNNEVLAREGIDTIAYQHTAFNSGICNNEVLAREGIDTIAYQHTPFNSGICNNEVLAREGIDTIDRPHMYGRNLTLVTMRY